MVISGSGCSGCIGESFSGSCGISNGYLGDNTLYCDSIGGSSKDTGGVWVGTYSTSCYGGGWIGNYSTCFYGGSSRLGSELKVIFYFS